MIDREARASVALDGETHSVERTLEEAEANEAQLWERLQCAQWANGQMVERHVVEIAKLREDNAALSKELDLAPDVLRALSFAADPTYPEACHVIINRQVMDAARALLARHPEKP